jgi:GNAT superfamily N-acetyltransferase
MTEDGRCFTVVWATSADFEAVMQLLSEARFWHVSRGVDVWGEFDTRQIEHNIADGRVFLAKCNGVVLGTVTLLENDPMVWGADDGTALYIHRLVSARTATGRGVGAKILRWAQNFAKEQGNRKMRAYYERQGFRYVRDAYFPPDSPLPADYRGSFKSLYELRFH